MCTSCSTLIGVTYWHFWLEKHIYHLFWWKYGENSNTIPGNTKWHSTKCKHSVWTIQGEKWNNWQWPWQCKFMTPGLASHTRSHEAVAKGRAATSSQGVQTHRDTVKVGPHSVATFEKTPLLFHPCSLWRCEGLQCLRHFCAECAITTGWKIRPPMSGVTQNEILGWACVQPYNRNGTQDNT